MNPALRAVLLTPAWTPLRLRTGRVGAWLDPSDFVYMTQDSAGTTAAAMNQPVGKIVDRMGFEAHGVQATSAARPTLSARVNRLIKTEALDNAAWLNNGAGTITTGIVDPNGGTAAAKFTSGAVNNEFYQAAAGTFAAGVNSMWLRRASGTGIVGISRANGNVYEDITASLSSSWQRFTTTAAASNGGYGYAGIIVRTSGDEVEIAFPQQDIGSAATRYQWVDTASSYDTSGFTLFIDYDVVDDALVCTFPVDMGTNCTVARAVRGTGASILTGQTIGTTYSDNTDHCGLVIVNGALNATETAKLTTYLNRKAGV